MIILFNQMFSLILRTKISSLMILHLITEFSVNLVLFFVKELIFNDSLGYQLMKFDENQLLGSLLEPVL